MKKTGPGPELRRGDPCEKTPQDDCCTIDRELSTRLIPKGCCDAASICARSPPHTVNFRSDAIQLGRVLFNPPRSVRDGGLKWTRPTRAAPHQSWWRARGSRSGMSGIVGTGWEGGLGNIHANDPSGRCPLAFRYAGLAQPVQQAFERSFVEDHVVTPCLSNGKSITVTVH